MKRYNILILISMIIFLSFSVFASISKFNNVNITNATFLNSSQSCTRLYTDTTGRILCDTNLSTETDPYFTNNITHYYNKTDTDARYLQSYTETDPYFINNITHYYNKTETNDTIDAKLTTIIYFPNVTNTSVGTVTSGNNKGNLTYIDDQYLNVTEVPGGFEIYVNFTNINTFNTVQLYLKYFGGSGHEVEMQLWNYGTSAWEDGYGAPITDMTNYAYIEYNIDDYSNHVSGGLVQMRLKHINSGNPSHKISIDRIIIASSPITLTNLVHDSLGGRDEPDNHPQYLLIDGTRNMSGELGFNEGVGLNTSYIQNKDDIYIGISEIDHSIYFYEDNLSSGERLYWDNAGDYFHFSDDIYADNSIRAGSDLYTAGSGDDLWLGTGTQASALFRAYANGNVVADNINTSKLKSGNISSGNITLDSVLVSINSDGILNFSSVSYPNASITLNLWQKSMYYGTLGTTSKTTGGSAPMTFERGLLIYGAGDEVSFPSSDRYSIGYATGTGGSSKGYMYFQGETAAANTVSSHFIFTREYGTIADANTPLTGHPRLMVSSNTSPIVNWIILENNDTYGKVLSTSDLLLGSNGYILTNTSMNVSGNFSATSLKANEIILTTNCQNGQVLKWKNGVGTCGYEEKISRLGRDVPNNNATTNNVTEINFDILANRNYTMKCVFLYTSAATSTGLVVNVSSNATAAYVSNVYSTWSSATAKVVLSNTAFNTWMIGTGSGGTSIIMPSDFYSDFSTTNDGKINITIRSEVEASVATLKRGSYCVLNDNTVE